MPPVFRPDTASGNRRTGSASFRVPSGTAVNELTCPRPGGREPRTPSQHLSSAQRALERGDRPAAIAAFERILAQKETPALHNNIGALHRAEGAHERALDHFHRALVLQPDFREAACNMGLALIDLGRLDDGVAHLGRVVSLAPDFVEAWRALGHGHQCCGDLAAARRCYESAVALRPDDAEAHNALGVLHNAAGRLDLAELCYRRALDRDPRSAGVCNNMGNLLVRLGRGPESLAYYERAMHIDPGFAEPVANILSPLLEACAWDRLAEVRGRLAALGDGRPSGATTGLESPFTSLLLADDPARHLACARAWAGAASRRVQAPASRHDFSARRNRRVPLTIGYLSANFNRHPVAYQMGGLFRCHDRRAFRIHGYVFGPDDGSRVRRRIRDGCDRFVDITSMGHAQAARAIREDGVDILVDLMGHTRGNRIDITALRPAPITVAYMGFLGTSGADFIDYLIADPVVVPPAQAVHYTEALVHLPGGYQVNDAELAVADTRERRSDWGLPENGVVFCSFNNPAKIDRGVFAAWMQILGEVEGSVLWLQGGNPMAVENLRRAAAARGVAAERLVFAQAVPLSRHLARLRLADLALDTFVYNGGATTSNALWAGVPVITVPGAAFVSRMSASALTAVGLPELICPDAAAYVHLAVGLARGRERLAALRRRLIHNRTTAPLFDTRRFTKTLESAYLEMWEIYRSGQRPRMIRVVAGNSADSD